MFSKILTNEVYSENILCMFWIIFGSFISLFLLIIVISSLKIQIIKDKKIKEHMLNILTAYIGGFLFVITVYLFVSGTNDKGMFDIGIDFLNSNRWPVARGRGKVRSILDEFAFGFILTYIIIFIRREYKKL